MLFFPTKCVEINEDGKIYLTCGIRCLKSFSVSCTNPVPVYAAHKPKSKGGMLNCCCVQVIQLLMSCLLQRDGSINGKTS